MIQAIYVENFVLRVFSKKGKWHRIWKESKEGILQETGKKKKLNQKNNNNKKKYLNFL